MNLLYEAIGSVANLPPPPPTGGGSYPYTATVNNGSFETPVQGDGNYTEGCPSDWTDQGSEIPGFLGLGTTGTNSSFTSGLPPFPDGVQGCFFRRTCAMSQDITLPLGGSVVVSLYAVQSPGSAQDMRVSFNGTVLDSWTPASGSWELHTCPAISCDAGTYTLLIEGLNTLNGGNVSVIDLVVVTVNAP